MPFVFEATEIDGPILITPRIFDDSRGHFFENYKRSDYHAAGIVETFVQGNSSRSDRHVLRGLHYQIAPSAQAKLVRCVRGAIFDVAVDIRAASVNFGRWIGRELSEDNRQILYVPAGFAHGFLALGECTEVCYDVSAEYHLETERGIAWNDPDIAINWPISKPLLSEKDLNYPRLANAGVFP
ncbi:MAG: dTDP-4-dehydrorhamnose 3,5-epimerase [marine bacterium B5-7]|nr:MAG: dTDP-4-dehydrorhamnose 3,5-epimerase [marine bacterium B5-7]